MTLGPLEMLVVEEVTLDLGFVGVTVKQVEVDVGFWITGSLRSLGIPLGLRYLIPCLYSSWDRRANLRGNSLPHIPQEYCIFSEWAWAFILWQTRFDIWLNPLPHSSHLYGLSFVWVNTWFRKFPANHSHRICETNTEQNEQKADTEGGKMVNQREAKTIKNFFSVNAFLHFIRSNLFDGILFRKRDTCGAWAPSEFYDEKWGWKLWK